MDFLKEIVKEIGDDFTQLASDIDETETLLTQVRTFLTLYSGSVYLAVYLIIRLLPLLVKAATGKTFFSLAVVKNFLDTNPDGYCLYFDTEAAVNKVFTIKSWN